MNDLPNPYATTTIPWGKTQGQINDLLKKYGCKSLRWTDLAAEDVPPAIDIKSSLIILEFSTPNQLIEKKATKQNPSIRDRGIVRIHQVRIMLPIPTEKMRNQLYRFLFYQLKNMLAAVQFGAFTFEQIFFSFLVIERGLTAYQLAGGNEATGKIDNIKTEKFKMLTA